MPQLKFTTLIHAPIQRVFDLARCVSLHKRQFEEHAIVAVQGKSSGLLSFRDHTTWKGKFGRKVRMFSIEVTEIRPPEYLKMEFRKDFFDQFEHEIFLKSIKNGTILIDHIEYEIEIKGFLPLISKRCIEKTITHYLEERNAMCKEYAEGNNWHAILP